jgi:hypothetical protein
MKTGLKGRRLHLAATAGVLVAAAVFVSQASAQWGAIVPFGLSPLYAHCTQGSLSQEPYCPGQPGGAADRALHLPGIGQVAGYVLTECRNQAGWAKTHDYDAHGVSLKFAYVWARNPAAGHHPEPMILLCSNQSSRLNHSYEGPDASLPCPSVEGQQTRPAGGGVGWDVNARSGWHAALFPQATGGFGRNDDGYWNYRFRNNFIDPVTVSLFGFCRYERQSSGAE